MNATPLLCEPKQLHAVRYLQVDGIDHPAQGIAMPRQTALPPSLAPRLISREAAAAYICVSPNTFDEMVKNGQMPQARCSKSDGELGISVSLTSPLMNCLPIIIPTLTKRGYAAYGPRRQFQTP